MSTLMVNDFSGSTNQHTAPNLIANNQSPFILNCAQDEDGNIASRLGSDMYGDLISGAGSIQGGLSHDKSDGTHTQYVKADTDLYYDNDGTWTNPTGGAAIFNANSTVEFENYIGRLYFIGSGDTEYLTYLSSNVSDVTVVSGNIAGKYLAVGNNRMVVGGSAGAPRRVYYSNVGNDTFTTTTDYIDFDAPVAALASLGEVSPFIGFDTSNNCYVFDPNTNYSKKLPGFGCASHRTLKVIQGHAIWLGRDGFFRYSSAEAYPTKISTPIENDVTQDSFFNQIAGTAWSSAAAGVYKNKYYCSVGNLADTVEGNTLNDCWLIFDLKQLTWSARTYTANGAGSVIWRWIDGDGNEQLMTGSRDDKSVYKLEVPDLYTDDDSSGDTNTVSSIYRTKHFELQGGQGEAYVGTETQKTLLGVYTKIYMASSGSAIAYNYSLDGATSYSSLTTAAATTTGYDWHWEHLAPQSTSDFKSFSLEINGSGNWKLLDMGLEVASKGSTELQIR